MLFNAENIVCCSWNRHNLVLERYRGTRQCVNCLKSGKKKVMKVKALCITCPGGIWMCADCFDSLHAPPKSKTSKSEDSDVEFQ